MQVHRFFAFVMVSCILLLAAAAGGAGQETAKSPVAYFPEKDYVFDTVLEGTDITHDFILQNRGNATLEIEKVATA